MTFLQAARDTLTDGGGTFTAEGRPVQRDTGYYVGGLVPTLKVPSDGLAPEALALALAGFVSKYSGTFSIPGVLLGIWAAGAYVYVDAVQYTKHRHVAMIRAARRGEYAIWSCGDNATIRAE